jgi:hypothetical protein
MAGEDKAKMILWARERRGPEKINLSGERDVSLPQAGLSGWAPFAGTGAGFS